MPKLEAIVLDTHVWLDEAKGRGRIRPSNQRRIDHAARAGVLYVCAITPWEIAMHARSGKLRVVGPVLDWLTTALRDTRTVVAPMDPAVAVDAVELPAWDHRDPADRLIVATARRLQATLFTRDGAILDYAETVRAVRAHDPG